MYAANGRRQIGSCPAHREASYCDPPSLSRTKLGLRRELIESDLCQSCVKSTLTHLGLMRREGSTAIQQRRLELETLSLNVICLQPLLAHFPQDVVVPVFGQNWKVPRLFEKPLMNTPLLPSCILFHVKAGMKYNPSFQASPAQTRTHAHVYRAKNGPAVSGCLFMLSQSTWAAAGPANDNICRLVFTRVLTLRSPQSLPVELTDFSCSEGTSVPECTNQSYFASGTR